MRKKLINSLLKALNSSGIQAQIDIDDISENDSIWINLVVSVVYGIVQVARAILKLVDIVGNIDITQYDVQQIYKDKDSTF